MLGCDQSQMTDITTITAINKKQSFFLASDSFKDQMKKSILHHYGHIVGGIVKEFLDTVINPISNEEPVRLSGPPTKLIFFFRKIAYHHGQLAAKHIVTGDIVQSVTKIRETTVDSFAEKFNEIWINRRFDTKSFKGLLSTAEE